MSREATRWLADTAAQIVIYEKRQERSPSEILALEGVWRDEEDYLAIFVGEDAVYEIRVIAHPIPGPELGSEWEQVRGYML